MATQETGDPGLWPESVPLPEDGDDLDAASVNVALEGLLDRTAWQKARLADQLLVPLFAAQQTDFPNASLGLFPKRFSPWPVYPSTATFERGGWIQTDVTDGGGLWWFLQISEAVEISMIAASIRGDDGPGANVGFPAAPDRPFMRFYRQPIGGGSATLLLTVADETANQAEYEAHHTIPENPAIPFSPTLTFAAGEYLVIEFVGHKGPQVGVNTLKLYGISVVPVLP